MEIFFSLNVAHKQYLDTKISSGSVPIYFMPCYNNAYRLTSYNKYKYPTIAIKNGSFSKESKITYHLVKSQNRDNINESILKNNSSLVLDVGHELASNKDCNICKIRFPKSLYFKITMLTWLFKDITLVASTTIDNTFIFCLSNSFILINRGDFLNIDEITSKNIHNRAIESNKSDTNSNGNTLVESIYTATDCRVENYCANTKQSNNINANENINTQLEPEPVSTQFEPEPVNTQFEPELVNTQLETEQVVTKTDIDYSSGVHYLVINEFPKYCVSNRGDVLIDKSHATVKKHKSSNGYLVRLRTKINDKYIKVSYFVHNLVGPYFVPNNDPSKTMIHHIDGNVYNNDFSNLQWINTGSFAQNIISTNIDAPTQFRRVNIPTNYVCKVIHEYPNYYICDNGTVRNIRRNTLVKSYLYRYKTIVRLCKIVNGISSQDSICVHELVAAYFVAKKTQLNNAIRHIDGNITNNHFTNLEWFYHSIPSRYYIAYNVSAPFYIPSKENAESNIPSIVNN